MPTGWAKLQENLFSFVKEVGSAGLTEAELSKTEKKKEKGEVGGRASPATPGLSFVFILPTCVSDCVRGNG